MSEKFGLSFLRRRHQSVSSSLTSIDLLNGIIRIIDRGQLEAGRPPARFFGIYGNSTKDSDLPQFKELQYVSEYSL